MIPFMPASYRASASDLAIQVSPLGLMEMSDEEFEVNGLRISRYSTYWAHYLGHMHAMRREVGEPMPTFNYVQALSDYLTNFSFGRGVNFDTPMATAAIVKPLLKRIWTQDNDQQSLLFECGQMGSVTGDTFVKIAYEDPFVDPAGRLHPGRVRIIPLNPAQCFPEWHPHDRHRIRRFKLKYRFWDTAYDGTRQVFTYTEIVTETGIEEYVNNELIDQRPNPLGIIPIVYIPNITVSGSPWGRSDIGDIIGLNREFNEKAREVSDIINYHSAPMTVITGAKISSLEKGPRRWLSLPKEATINNLQALVELEGPISYMELVKRGMHEMTGVPETALGQQQPVSNTSGVALAIQFAPTMQRHRLKTNNWSSGLRRINEIALLTLFQREPQALLFNESEGYVPEPGQLLQLDPADPNTYETSVQWPEPLPVDVLVKLNEETQKITLGLQSKKGALRELGEEDPQGKLAEIFTERLDELKEAGAQQLVSSSITAAVVGLTGMVPGPDGTAVPVEEPADDNGQSKPEGAQTGPSSFASATADQVMNDLVTKAYGTKSAQYRNPANQVAD